MRLYLKRRPSTGRLTDERIAAIALYPLRRRVVRAEGIPTKASGTAVQRPARVTTHQEEN